MKGRFERSTRPLVVASQDDVIALFNLALEAHRLSVGEKPEFELLELGPSATVTLQNGDIFKCSTVEDVFKVRDAKSNPIREVSIEGGYYSAAHVNIKVGGRWSHSKGATLQLHSDESFAQRAEEVFNKIFVKERALKDFIPTMHPLLLATIVLIYLGYATNFILEGVRISHKEAAIWGSFLAICLFSFSICFSAIEYLQYRFLGRAIFNWGEGEVRYEKINKIINFALWTLPLTVAIKLLVK